jgi:peptide/nickel transport system substrate-binding protein
VTRICDQVFTLRRNPYFVGVDPDGNQLPYIDEVRFTFFADIQALNLAAIAGEFDIQERHIQMTNYPVFKENEKSGKYRVITWPTFGGSDAVVAFNQSYKADLDAQGIRLLPSGKPVSPSWSGRSRLSSSSSSVST